MALSTSTSTLAAGASRTFNLSPGSALTLVVPPNVRATVTETPNTVSASDVGGNASRTHNLQMVQTVTYGPYPMGGTVVVANASNSGATITWVRSDSIVAESAAGAVSLVDGAGNVFSPAGSLTTITTSGSTTLTTVATQRVTLGGTHQLTMPASPGAVAESFLLILTCAGFTPTWSGVTWLTSSGVAPTLNTVAGKLNVLTFVWDNSLPGWLGFMSGSQV